MNVDFTRCNNIIFFGGILTFLSIFLSWCFYQIFPSPPFWIETLSPLVAYGLLFSLFNKYLWHWRVFRIVGIVTVSDLRGRWTGKQISSYKENGMNKEIPCYLEITQSFSKIFVRAYYQKSQSESLVAGFTKLNDQVYLYYTYDNDPNSLKSGTMQSHKGTVKLMYSQKENKLMGFYFNSIGNQGEMQYDFETRETLFRFKK